MRSRNALLGLGAMAVLLLAGCQDPYARDHQARTPAADVPASAGGDGDRPGPPPSALGSAPGTRATTASLAASRFALGWVNWDWRDAAAAQRRLARVATGQLARDLRSGAHSVQADASLARDRPGSRGAVVAVELNRDGASASGVVVTREQSYTAGHADLGGLRYRVYLVRIVRAGGGWGVSRWAPQQ
jgi:hypothetical protein